MNTDAFGGFEDAVGGQDFDLLPADTRVLAELKEVKVESYDGRISPTMVWHVTGLPSNIPPANYGKPRIWDRFKLKFPKTESQMAGQTEEAIAKWKTEKAIWARTIAAVCYPAMTPKDGVTEFLKAVGPATENDVMLVLSSRAGSTVIIQVTAEAAGKEYTKADGTPAKTAKGKNGVRYYEPDTPAARAKYGLVGAGSPTTF